MGRYGHAEDAGLVEGIVLLDRRIWLISSGELLGAERDVHQPTPKPSALMLLASRRRRESLAWLMMECAGRVRISLSSTGAVDLTTSSRHMRQSEAIGRSGNRFRPFASTMADEMADVLPPSHAQPDPPRTEDMDRRRRRDDEERRDRERRPSSRDRRRDDDYRDEKRRRSDRDDDRSVAPLRSLDTAHAARSRRRDSPQHDHRDSRDSRERRRSPPRRRSPSPEYVPVLPSRPLTPADSRRSSARCDPCSSRSSRRA